MDAVIFGKVSDRYSRIQSEENFLALDVCQRRASSGNTSSLPGSRNARNRPLAYEGFLEFGERRKDVEHQLATGR